MNILADHEWLINKPRCDDVDELCAREWNLTYFYALRHRRPATMFLICRQNIY